MGVSPSSPPKTWRLSPFVSSFLLLSPFRFAGHLADVAQSVEREALNLVVADFQGVGARERRKTAATAAAVAAAAAAFASCCCSRVDSGAAPMRTLRQQQQQQQQQQLSCTAKDTAGTPTAAAAAAAPAAAAPAPAAPAATAAAAAAAAGPSLLPWQQPCCRFVSDSGSDVSPHSLGAGAGAAAGAAARLAAAAAAAAAALKEEAAKSYFKNPKQENAKALALSPPGLSLSPAKRPPLAVLLRCLTVIWHEQQNPPPY
ncbi:hypothetical protein EBH_0029960 [Eimeria brunetti]|uniref:Uncharacterized protein n=1 Tax=Eimeria brunetti TaxID=51314 RepID=U6LHZ7_9EIME|nr:hypothetical protein EBH_0029960 [Eimeria brunetti]